ncbi:hypothetical protein D3C84_724700 [compost metagenome]|jgi:hypothetical protein
MPNYSVHITRPINTQATLPNRVAEVHHCALSVSSMMLIHYSDGSLLGKRFLCEQVMYLSTIEAIQGDFQNIRYTPVRMQGMAQKTGLRVTVASDELQMEFITQYCLQFHSPIVQFQTPMQLDPLTVCLFFD